MSRKLMMEYMNSNERGRFLYLDMTLPFAAVQRRNSGSRYYPRPFILLHDQTQALSGFAIKTGQSLVDIVFIGRVREGFYQLRRLQHARVVVLGIGKIDVSANTCDVTSVQFSG